MENQPTQVGKTKKSRGPKVNGFLVKRLFRKGKTLNEIALFLNVTEKTVQKHLIEQNVKVKTVRVQRSVNPQPTVIKTATSFEADLFGTLIVLDQVPTTIERIGNRIVIK